MSLYQYERDGEAQEIIRVLRESDNPAVRQRAARLLGELDGHDDRRDIVRALVRAVEEDDADAVVTAAVDALDRLGQDALETLVTSMAGVELEDGAADWVTAKAFVRALNAEIPELRLAAANGLGELGQADAVPALVDRLDDPDPRVRARAARACGRIGDPRATDALASVLGDPKATVRREAAEALGRIGNRQALRALLELYDDDDERVRRIAVSGFGQFTNDRPVEYLVEALGDSSGAVRRRAVFSLVELLSNVPTERSHEIREAVVAELSETDDEAVVASLVEILAESTQTAQRRNTAWLLGRVADGAGRAVVDALVDALTGEDQMTRQFAATSLAEAGGGAYLERTLFEVAEDDDRESDVRAQAVFVLGKVGDGETADRLERLLEGADDEQVRQRAFSALSKLGGHG